MLSASILVLIVTLSTPAFGQTPAAPQAPAPAASPASRQEDRIPLKVLVTISKFQGDKKVSSYPYDLYVLVNADMTRLRVGMDVALQGPPEIPVVNTNRNAWVGTKIDCRANGAGAGPYSLWLSVEDSSVYTPSTDGKATGLSVLRTYTISNNVLLKDGQTLQLSAGTDKVSGEIVKVDVTLTVLK
jgi:hypothetical protein